MKTLDWFDVSVVIIYGIIGSVFGILEYSQAAIMTIVCLIWFREVIICTKCRRVLSDRLFDSELTQASSSSLDCLENIANLREMQHKTVTGYYLGK